jgi:hypothetical protein
VIAQQGGHRMVWSITRSPLTSDDLLAAAARCAHTWRGDEKPPRIRVLSGAPHQEQVVAPEDLEEIKKIKHQRNYSPLGGGVVSARGFCLLQFDATGAPCTNFCLLVEYCCCRGMFN